MKKPTDIYHALVAFLLFTGGMALTGCATDEDIDLGDIDMHVGIGSDGFQLPSSSSNNIILRDVLEINEDDVIETTENGDYRFVKEDEIEPVYPKIQQVNFASPTTTLWNFEIPTTPVPPISGWGSFDLPAQKITTFDYANETETQIKELIKADAKGTIKLTFTTTSLKPYFKQIAQLKLNLPYFILFDVSQGTIVRDDTKQEQSLTLTNVTTESDLSLTFDIKGLTNIGTTKPSAGDQQYVVVNEGGYYLNAMLELSLSLSENDIKSGITSFGANISTSASIGNIIISHAEGYFDPTIDPLFSSVDITGIPDFLNDKEVNILLTNPTITMTVDNNINVAALLNSAKITATYDDNSTKVMNFAKNSFKIYPHNSTAESTTSKIVICRVAGNEVGTQYIIKDGSEGPSTDANVTDIQELLKKIPNSLKFDIDITSDTDYKGSIDLYDPASSSSFGKDYAITSNYSFESKLTMDQGSTIVYNDSIDDFNKDIKDNEIELTSGTEVVITATVKNTTPLKLYLDPTAFNLQKKEIPGITITLTTDKQDGGGYYVPSNYGTEDTSSIKIVCKSATPEIFKQLEGIAFKVKAVTEKSGIPLNDHTQIVKIDNMKIGLTGQISINADSKD